MECTAKIQTTQVDTTEVIENKRTAQIQQNDTIDEESRKHRQYLAEQEALRRLERIKTQALVTFMR